MASSKKLAEGEECVRQAEKWLKTGLLKWRPDYFSAATDYEKAATCFKAASAMDRTRDCLIKAGECYIKNNSFFSAGKQFEKAAMIYKDMNDYQTAIRLFEKACQLFREHGSPDTAALCLERGARVLEAKFPDKAIEFYQRASEIVMAEDRPRQAAEYAGKATKLLLKLRRFDDAVNMLKREMDCHIQGESNQAAGRLVVSLVLVHLARDDYVAAKKAFETYYSYVEREEVETLHQLLDGYDQGDPEQMAQALNHPFIKFMDTEYAKLARTLQASCGASMINESAVIAAKKKAAAAAAVNALDEEEELGAGEELGTAEELGAASFADVVKCAEELGASSLGDNNTQPKATEADEDDEFSGGLL